MENKAHALAAGIFVLLIGGLVVALAMWLTRDSGVKHFYEMSTREAVSGLQPQAAVRYRGIDIGKVVHIGFDPQATGNALVRIAVDDRAPITRSTYATLGYQGVTGLAYVQLDDDGESKEPLVGNADGLPRIPMRPGTLSKITDRGLAIMAEAEQTMAQARETMVRITALLSPENQTAIVATVTDLGAAAQGISRAADGFDKVAFLMAAIAILAGVIGLSIRTILQPRPVHVDHWRPRTKVYRQAPAQAHRPLLDRLARAETGLKQWLQEKKIEADWKTHLTHFAEAERLLGAGDQPGAFREFCRAMRPLTAALESQRSKDDGFPGFWEKTGNGNP